MSNRTHTEPDQVPVRKGGENVKTKSQLQSEIDFIHARALADRECHHPRCYGRSSDCLMWLAIAGAEPVSSPLDTSDLLACELTYRMAPAHLQPRMMPTLVAWRALVEAKYPGTATRIEEALTRV